MKRIAKNLKRGDWVLVATGEAPKQVASIDAVVRVTFADGSELDMAAWEAFSIIPGSDT